MNPEGGPQVSVAELVSRKSTESTVGNIKRLIKGEVNTEFQLLNETIGNESKRFKDSMDQALLGRNESAWAAEQDKLDTWTTSEEGQETLSHLVAACVDLINDDSYNGPPAHDKSHYLKDLYSGLIATKEDNYRPWEKESAVIGSLMHDFGKMLEVPLTGKHSTGVVATDHANIGFFLVDRLIKSYGNMPQGMEDQILYSIITHQQGTSKETIAQLVQRSDREQLVGSEGVRRMFIADAGLEHRTVHTGINPQRNTELPLPAKPDDTDLFHHIEFYMRNLYPQIGTNGNARAEDLKAEGGIFLWLSSPDEVRKQIFAPEFERDEKKSGEEYQQGENKFKKVLKSETWEKIKEGPTEEDRREMDKFKDLPLDEILERFVARKNTNLVWQTEKDGQAENVLDNLGKQIGQLTEEEKKSLHEGLSFALVRVEKHENEMIKGTEEISTSTKPGSAENQIAQLVLRRYGEKGAEGKDHEDS